MGNVVGKNNAFAGDVVVIAETVDVLVYGIKHLGPTLLRITGCRWDDIMTCDGVLHEAGLS